jgi:hypothetical protein
MKRDARQFPDFAGGLYGPGEGQTCLGRLGLGVSPAAPLGTHLA